MVIRRHVFMMKKSTQTINRLTYMATWKVGVFVRIVNTTQRVSTVIDANRNSIDHMESTGMKPTCADVSSTRIKLIL